jgi:hypothetical protein
LALVPAGVVTVTSTVPMAVAAGAVAVIVVSLTTVKDAAAVEPKLTAVAPRKSVPVMVTRVPPTSGPLVGLTAVTTGCTTPAVVMPRGKVNLVTVAVTLLVARSMTETVPEPLSVT